jgi:hypothetical protein
MARKQKEAEAPVEPAIEQAEGGGLGIDEGIVLSTFILLIGAIVLVYIANNSYLMPQ